MFHKVLLKKASYYVVAVSLLEPHVLEAVLADPELWHFPVLFWVGAEVPGVHFVLAHLYLVNVFHFCNGFVLFFQRGCCGIHFSVRLSVSQIYSQSH